MNTYRSMVLIPNDSKSMEYGAEEVYNRFQSEIYKNGLEAKIALMTIGNVGRHDASPIVIIYPEAVIYGPVQPDDVPFLVDEHLKKGLIASNLLASPRQLSHQIAWVSAREGTLPAEQRIVLNRVGKIDPESLDDYMQFEGFSALERVLSKLEPQEVIDEIQKSGLRGRGGAGFPTGTKWGFVSKAKGQPKYVICNADESEPGTYKDRILLENDPFNIIEAMTIAAYAIGASEGYIYVRGEYSFAQQRLKSAIKQANERGLLGDNILDSEFCFHIHIHSGAGAYICGEETALIESLEGKRGEPRNRPPYPVTHGLWGKPTVVNNVETLANITAIISHGAGWFRNFGTLSSPGTKVFALLGNVNQTRLIEVPMGITLREVITIHGLGMKDDARFKLAQTGGSSGTVIPASLQDTPMDFDSFRDAGVSLGSGALLICDEYTCVIDLAMVLSNFFQNESCGKCTPCRVGNHRTNAILKKIMNGKGSLTDIKDLEMICNNMIMLSHCGLGQTAGLPTRDILNHFRAEAEAHVRLQVCPTGICPMGR